MTSEVIHVRGENRESGGRRKAAAATLLFSGDRGDGTATLYSVFPGVTVAVNAVHTDLVRQKTETPGERIEIHFCREGRIERESGDDTFFLTPGHLSVSVSDAAEAEYVFPLSHYHGVSVVIRTDTAPGCFSSILEDVDVRPERIAGKLCGDQSRFVIRADGRLEKVFAEIDSAAKAADGGMLRVKVLELLLLLDGYVPEENAVASAVCPGSYVKLAKSAARYLSARMNEVITVKELAETFNVSGTHLQNCMRAVYGVPVSSYIRVLKMQEGAYRLTHSEKSVIEIAGELGYDNASKFSSAFKRILGETPTEYRRNHGVPRESV